MNEARFRDRLADELFPRETVSTDPLALIRAIEADRHPRDPATMRFRRLYNEIVQLRRIIIEMRKPRYGADPKSA
jgi:hypothetical protein